MFISIQFKFLFTVVSGLVGPRPPHSLHFSLAIWRFLHWTLKIGTDSGLSKLLSAKEMSFISNLIQTYGLPNIVRLNNVMDRILQNSILLLHWSKIALRSHCLELFMINFVHFYTIIILQFSLPRCMAS